MKRNFLLIVSTAMVCGAMLFNGCKKDDTTSPVITLTGNELVTIDLGDTYTDAGATADDDNDGDITSNIVVTGIPANTNEAGEYIIKYNVEDEAGNAATEVTRTLHIRTNKLAGQYEVKELNDVDTDSTLYNIDVVQSSTTFNKLIIGNFGAYGSAIKIEAIVEGSDISIPTQTFEVSGITYTVSGSGGTYDGAAFKLIKIKYNAKWTESGTNYNLNFVATIKKKY